jgi:patatin-like phospholipase/acyl hydrolase
MSDPTISDKSKRLRLLCLDGGGVRGVSEIVILHELMKIINFDNPPKPSEVFDMVGGTSTGG